MPKLLLLVPRMQQCMWCIRQSIAFFGTDTNLKCPSMELLYLEPRICRW